MDVDSYSGHWCGVCAEHNIDETHRCKQQPFAVLVFCRQCGRPWYPTLNESETFPGSGCDVGECICLFCEAAL